MTLTKTQTRLLIGVVAAFLVAAVGATGADGTGHLLPIPDSLITPLQALIAGVAGVLTVSDDATEPAPQITVGGGT